MSAPKKNPSVKDDRWEIRRLAKTSRGLSSAEKRALDFISDNQTMQDGVSKKAARGVEDSGNSTRDFRYGVYGRWHSKKRGGAMIFPGLLTRGIIMRSGAINGGRALGGRGLVPEFRVVRDVLLAYQPASIELNGLPVIPKNMEHNPEHKDEHNGEHNTEHKDEHNGEQKGEHNTALMQPSSLSSFSSVRSGKLRESSQSSPSSSPAPQIGAAPKSTEDPGAQNPRSFSGVEPNLTLPKETDDGAGMEDPDLATVGDIPTDSLKEMLTSISDGTFETGALENYPDREALETACRQVLRQFGAAPLSDRTVSLRLTRAVMNACEGAGIHWPPGFLKVVKTLEAGGGLQVPRPNRKCGPQRGDVFAGGSVLTFFRKELLPYKDRLQKIADGKADSQYANHALAPGVPQTFAEGADFLQQVYEDFSWDSGEVPADFVRVQEKMQWRAAASVPEVLSNQRGY